MLTLYWALRKHFLPWCHNHILILACKSFKSFAFAFRSSLHLECKRSVWGWGFSHGTLGSFPWPITLCIHSLHCGFDIFLFFLDWKSEINDLFSLCSSIWETELFSTPSLFIYTHTCIIFMFYRNPVIQILCIWGYPSSICVEILSWQITV